MPNAGGICPPTITPLRKKVIGQTLTRVDSNTLIKLCSDTSGCKIYFTTDGTKPSPFKRKVAGQEVTFKYLAPFTLKQGKRTIKAIAVSRDGLQESAIITKTIIVENTQKHTTDDYYDMDLPYSDLKHNSSFRNSGKQNLSLPESMETNYKQAWTGPTCVNISDTPKEVDNPAVPFYPTNYSGTQINMFGIPADKLPFGLQDFYKGIRHSTQFGFITEQMIQGLYPHSKAVTIGDIRRLLEENKKLTSSQASPPPLPEPLPIEMKEQPPNKEFPLENINSGQGDIKSQIMHISAHILQYAKSDKNFARNIAQSQMGKMLTADFSDEGDGYKITLVMTKPGNTKKKYDVPKKADIFKIQTKKKIQKSDPYFEMETEDISQEGTVKPYPNFNAESDCQMLHTAMKGLGTDEDAIINILAYRSNAQRQEIIKTFKTMFGKELIKELKGELSGNLKECVKSLCMKPAEFDAEQLHNAMKHFGTDESVLIEVLCTRSNAQIKQIVFTYHEIFNRDLEKDIVSETSGHLKRLLVSMVSANRSESKEINKNQAYQDAKSLYEAGEKKWGTDESKFHTILVTRSFPQLRAIFQEYAKISKKNIEEVLKSELSGDFLHGMLTIVCCVKNKANYFAQQLQKAMKGVGTDDKSVIRIIVSRCEIDLVQIQEEFFNITNQQLEDYIAGDLSGDYRKIILSLISTTMSPDLNKDKAMHEIPQWKSKQMEGETHNITNFTGTFPTVMPYSDFNSKKDCETLHQAFKGFGTDEKAIINVIAYRCSEQRVEIRKDFKKIYGQDLIKELKSELSGHFKDVAVNLCMTMTEFDATQLNKAIKGIGTDEKVLTEIICSRNNEQLKEIKIVYERLFKDSLEADVSDDTSGGYKRILISLLQCLRQEDKAIDCVMAKKDAQRLYEAGESKLGTDEAVFIDIFCTNSFAQLLTIFKEYKAIYKKDIEDIIKAEMSGNTKDSLLAIVECSRNTAVYFASILYKALKGLGTDDNTLIRVVISRSEIDMEKIKEEFKKLYKQTLQDFINDDISGDYKKIILALVNGNKR